MMMTAASKKIDNPAHVAHDDDSGQQNNSRDDKGSRF